MATRVTINEKGIIQSESGTPGVVDINVPLSLNSTATIGGLSVMGVNSASGAIQTLTLTTPGTGYSSTVSVALGGGTGTGATASIAVSGGAVQWVGLLNPGSGYTAGDVLTIPGGGGNATITVLAVVPKNDASGHLTAQRIGAGTTQPNAGIDSRFAARFSGFQRITRVIWNATNTSQVPSTIEITGDIDPSISGSTSHAGIYQVSRNLATNGTTFGAIFAPVCVNTTAATAVNLQGVWSRAQRGSATDVSTNVAITGFNTQLGVASGGAASYQSSQVAGYNNGPSWGVPHTVADYSAFREGATSIANTSTITDYHQFVALALSISAGAAITNFYGLRLRAVTATGGAVITNRWGVSIEDASANNVFAGRSAMGQAAGTVATANVDVGASTTAASALRLRSGTAPTAPNDGDIWFDGTDLKIRVAGVTRTVTIT